MHEFEGTLMKLNDFWLKLAGKTYSFSWCMLEY